MICSRYTSVVPEPLSCCQVSTDKHRASVSKTLKSTGSSVNDIGSSSPFGSSSLFVRVKALLVIRILLMWWRNLVEIRCDGYSRKCVMSICARLSYRSTMR
jgi:hypothetical protein